MLEGLGYSFLQEFRGGDKWAHTLVCLGFWWDLSKELQTTQGPQLGTGSEYKLLKNWTSIRCGHHAPLEEAILSNSTCSFDPLFLLTQGLIILIMCFSCETLSN